jgi:hypothetical protein
MVVGIAGTEAEDGVAMNRSFLPHQSRQTAIP